ncbi:MAG: RidA/YER057c/UK114 superfamily, group 1, partial [uncultured Thermomicrobiales bacterium]
GRPNRRAADGTGDRAAAGAGAGRQLCPRRADREPALPRRQRAAKGRRHDADGQGGRRCLDRGGERARALGRPHAPCRSAAGAGRPRPGAAGREGARHGQRDAGLRPAATGDQRLLRSLRRGFRRAGTTRALGGRDGLAAGGHHRRDRGDRRGRV